MTDLRCRKADHFLKLASRKSRCLKASQNWNTVDFLFAPVHVFADFWGE